MAAHPENLLWLDFETTGLMSDAHLYPLEVAGIITDAALNEVAVFDSHVVTAPQASLDAMVAFVRQMHTGTGLLERLDPEGQPLEAVDAELAGWIALHFPAKKSPLPDGTIYRGVVVAGNSVGGLDRPLLDRFFPATAARCDYRVLDVSSIGELLRRQDRSAWETAPAKRRTHDAMGDIRESLAEVRHYTARMFG